MTASSGKGGGRKQVARPCPICGKERVAAYHPFCSKGCADLDLNRWLSGRYVVPVEQDDDDAGATGPGDIRH